MTPLQAFKQAQETGQIAITKETATIINAVAKLDEAAENLMRAIENNMPCEMSDIETCDKISNEFYNRFNPVMEYVFSTVGEISLKRCLFYQLINKFEGI